METLEELKNKYKKLQEEKIISIIKLQHQKIKINFLSLLLVNVTQIQDKII